MTVSVKVHVNGTSHKAKCTVGDSDPVYVGDGEERFFHPHSGNSLIVEEVDADEGGAHTNSGGGGHGGPPPGP